MKIDHEVAVLAAAQQQLALLFTTDAPEGAALVTLILKHAAECFAGTADVRHNSALLRKLGTGDVA
jgi:hypothetical protein